MNGYKELSFFMTLEKVNFQRSGTKILDFLSPHLNMAAEETDSFYLCFNDLNEKKASLQSKGKEMI